MGKAMTSKSSVYSESEKATLIFYRITSENNIDFNPSQLPHYSALLWDLDWESWLKWKPQHFQDFFLHFLSNIEASVNSLKHAHSFPASSPLFLPRYHFFIDLWVLSKKVTQNDVKDTMLGCQEQHTVKSRPQLSPESGRKVHRLVFHTFPSPTPSTDP